MKTTTKKNQKTESTAKDSTTTAVVETMPIDVAKALTDEFFTTGDFRNLKNLTLADVERLVEIYQTVSKHRIDLNQNFTIEDLKKAKLTTIKTLASQAGIENKPLKDIYKALVGTPKTMAPLRETRLMENRLTMIRTENPELAELIPDFTPKKTPKNTE